MNYSDNELHRLSEIVLLMEDCCQRMYDNPLAGKDPAYLKKVDELQEVTIVASQQLQSHKTRQMAGLSGSNAGAIDDLEDKVSKVQAAVSITENISSGIQAAADLIAAVRHVFGIPI